MLYIDVNKKYILSDLLLQRHLLNSVFNYASRSMLSEKCQQKSADCKHLLVQVIQQFLKNKNILSDLNVIFVNNIKNDIE